MNLFKIELWLPWQLFLTNMWDVVTGGYTPYPCPDSLALTYTLGHSLPTIKEWGIVKEDCFDRLLQHESWTDNIVYCPNQLFCGTNLTLHFLNSFPSVTKHDARECDIYTTSIDGCAALKKLINRNDVNECLVARLGCGPCENFVGGYWCNCVDGFDPDASEQICSDRDECEKDDPCDQIAGNCTNFVGFFDCRCNDGFEGDGFECRDIDECARPQSCHFKANCSNFPASYSCDCQSGYQGDGFKNCEDIDECDTNTDSCDDLTSYCLNHEGTYECFCKVGFEKSPDGICEDFNECEELADDVCPDLSECINMPGNYTCACIDGYYKSGDICSDLDECNLTPAEDRACGDDFKYTCENSPFPFRCSCNTGFETTSTATCTGPSACEGFECSDIDECDQNLCHQTATCENTEGSFDCNCPDGYDEVSHAGYKQCISPVITLGQKNHTDEHLDGKRVTSLEYTNTQTGFEIFWHLYSKQPLASLSNYIQISIYTKSVTYEKEIQQGGSGLVPVGGPVTTWRKTYAVSLLYLTSQAVPLPPKHRNASLLGEFYTCVSNCESSAQHVKVCDLGEYMTMFTGDDKKCADWAGSKTDLSFRDKLPSLS